ncbi:hypothetical protein P9112_012222 [Eukaryota sp. TZLM1-RC]
MTVSTTLSVPTVAFQSSQLGCINYWNSFYEQETSYSATGGDLECWYEETLEGVLQMIVNLPLTKSEPILDVGTGNASFLVTLFNMNFTNLLGTDYAPQSVKLSKIILSQNKVNARIIQDDILNTQLPSSSFSLIHDKGTLDAIMLSGISDYFEQYIKAITYILKPGGYFCITSSNFTADELISGFCSASLFEVVSQMRHSSFSFGGITGNSRVSFILKKID